MAAGEAAWPSDGRAAVSVIMLNEEMARRAGVPARVAGYAAARPEIGGRVAFVLARRTQAIATRGGVPHDDVLAAVIAHELGHLLMPRRPHGRVGLMRPDWRPEEFGDAQLRAFTHEEERHLRESAERLGAYPTRAD